MSFATLRTVQDQLAQAGGKPLGSLLWWQLNGNRIEHDQLEDLARRHGLNDKYLPSEIKPAQAFRRACRHATTKMPVGMLLRPIGESADEIVVGLVNERPDAVARDIDYDLVSRVVFDKRSNAITCDVENGVVWELQQLYRHHMALTTEDVRHMLSAFLSEAGVSLRDSGGVYFVAAPYQATLDALCRVVEAVGKNTTFQLPIVDTAATRSVLREVAKQSLDDEVQQLQAELLRFEADKVRQSTLERKLDGFEELRSRVTLFARVLSFKAEALNDKIGAIQSSLRRQLAGDNRPAVPGLEAANDQPTETAVRQLAAGGVGF